MKSENLEKIKTAIKEFSISQKELAAISGLTTVQVNEILSGKRRFKSCLLAAAIESFTKGKVSAKWIIERDLLDNLDADIEGAKESIRTKLNHNLQEIQNRLNSIG